MCLELDQYCVRLLQASSLMSDNESKHRNQLTVSSIAANLAMVLHPEKFGCQSSPNYRDKMSRSKLN